MGASKAPPLARIFNWFPCVAFLAVVVAVFNYSRKHGKAKDAQQTEQQNSRTDGADAETVRAAAIEADLQFSVNKPNKPFGRRCVYAMCAKEHKANGRDLSAFSCT